MPKLLDRISTRDASGKLRLVLRLAWSRERPRRGMPPTGRTFGEVYLALREGGEVVEVDSDTFKVKATGEILRRQAIAETVTAEAVSSRLPRLAIQAERTEPQEERTT